MHHTSILELAPDSAFTGLYVPPPLNQVAFVRGELVKFIKKGLESFPATAKLTKISPEVVPVLVQLKQFWKCKREPSLKPSLWALQAPVG
jgi:hypothetical protein